MSVDLGGADVGMTKHSLDAAKVGAVHEKMVLRKQPDYLEW